MKINSFIIEILNGEIKWKSDHHRDLFLRFVQQFSDGKYRLDINTIKSIRSLEQNNYYWFYLGVVSDDTGYTPEEVHEWAKGKFITKEIKEVFGDLVRIKGTTTNQSRGEFAEYLMKIAQETGIQLPDTSEFYGYSYHK
jgi:hypothetical protein